jgi:hypothetical protein
MTDSVKDITQLLKLRPREVSVLNQAIASRAEFGIEDTILNDNAATTNAAKRMIEKGYLSKGKAKLSPNPGWVVVRFTEKNRRKMLSDAGIS